MHVVCGSVSCVWSTVYLSVPTYCPDICKRSHISVPYCERPITARYCTVLVNRPNQSSTPRIPATHPQLNLDRAIDRQRGPHRPQQTVPEPTAQLIQPSSC